MEKAIQSICGPVYTPVYTEAVAAELGLGVLGDQDDHTKTQPGIFTYPLGHFILAFWEGSDTL